MRENTPPTGFGQYRAVEKPTQKGQITTQKTTSVLPQFPQHPQGLIRPTVEQLSAQLNGVHNSEANGGWFQGHLKPHVSFWRVSQVGYMQNSHGGFNTLPHIKCASESILKRGEKKKNQPRALLTRFHEVKPLRVELHSYYKQEGKLSEERKDEESIQEVTKTVKEKSLRTLKWINSL